ncbi:MAG TPA: hypothetical protein VN132_04085, partial [Bdellovibrio sp.]|nr:hypothetical protein [Bdellovibrio sp.]
QDLESIKKDIGDNKSAAKTDLIIAGTTALAATILTIWLSRRTGRDEIAEYNLAFSAASIVVGAAITVTKGTQAGYHYLLVKLDQNKLPVLEQKLAALKAQLEKQTAELIK